MNKPAVIAVEEQEQPARFTAEEFMAIAEAGAFAEFVGKIELVEGVIVRMSPPHNPHFYCQRQLFLALHNIFGDGLHGWIIGQEPAVRLGDMSVRCPDVATLRDIGPIDGIFDAADLLLAVEVSDSTLATDRGSKRLSYAEAGIAHYWVVDVRGRTIETMREPKDGDYAVRDTTAFGDDLPVPGTDATIRLD